MTRSAFDKKISGTLRPDRVRRSSVETALTELPDPPSEMSPLAAMAWLRLGRLAIEAGTLTRFDTELLSLAARTAATCEELESQLGVDGILITSKSVVKAHPACAALDRSRSLLLKLLDALGLSPGGRDRLPAIASVSATNRFAQMP